MKTEHRHELKANDLQEVAVKVESFYERNAASLQWAIIGVAFLLACGIYYWRTTAAVEAAAWNELSQSETADQFSKVATDYDGSRAAGWAKLRAANSYLETYLRDSFENREKANTDLKNAKEILTGLTKTGGPSEFRQQVLFAYARATEMGLEGDTKPAVEAYETLLKDFPETVFKREAEHRIRALKSPQAQEFYAFFSKQNPKPAAPPKPNDAKAGGFGGGGDPFKAITPGLGEIQDKAATGVGGVPLLSPPKLPELTGPSETKPEEPAADKKADDKPAAEEKKTEEKKAEEKPAETKPAEEKPAADKPAAEADKTTEEKPAAEPEKTPEDKPAEKQE